VGSCTKTGGGVTLSRFMIDFKNIFILFVHITMYIGCDGVPYDRTLVGGWWVVKGGHCQG